MLRRRSASQLVGGSSEDVASRQGPDALQQAESPTIEAPSGGSEAWPTIWLTVEGQFLESSQSVRDLFGEDAAEGGGSVIGRLRLTVMKYRDDIATGDMVPKPRSAAG